MTNEIEDDRPFIVRFPSRDATNQFGTGVLCAALGSAGLNPGFVPDPDNPERWTANQLTAVYAGNHFLITIETTDHHWIS